MAVRSGRLCSVGVLLFLGLIVAVPIQAQAPKIDRAADKAAVEQTFREYIAIFLTGDLKKVTAHYNEPLMLVATSRAVNRAEAEVIMGKIRDDLQARGIAEFVFDRLEVKMLGENVALVSFIIKQQAKDGAVVNVSAGTYSLRRADSGWKIAVISTYPPADFVKLD